MRSPLPNIAQIGFDPRTRTRRGPVAMAPSGGRTSPGHPFCSGSTKSAAEQALIQGVKCLFLYLRPFTCDTPLSTDQVKQWTALGVA